MTAPGRLAQAMLAFGGGVTMQTFARLFTYRPNQVPIVLADPHTIADVRISRGRSSATEGTQAGTMSLTLAGDPDSLGLEVGLPLSLQVLGPPVPIADIKPALIRFAGQITDLGDIRIDPRTGTRRTPVLASGLLARFGGARFGRVPWPAGTDDWTILYDTLTSLWAADPGVRVLDWMNPPAPGAWPDWFDYLVPTPADQRFVPWDVDAQSAAQILDELVTSTGAELVERRRGTIAWIRPDSRRLSRSFTLPSTWIQSPAAAQRHLADTVTVARVSYGVDGASSVTATDEDSFTKRGVWPTDISTRLATTSAATRLATDIVARYGQPGWRLSTVKVDFLAILEQAALELAGPTPRPTYALMQSLITADIGWWVQLAQMPANSPIPDGRWWIVGMDESITAQSWDITLALVPWEHLAAATRYSDVTPAANYANQPADLTYLRSSFRLMGA